MGTLEDSERRRAAGWREMYPDDVQQFLSTIKEPSELEAEIGKLYQHSGLDAAFALIERSVLPAFERQEKNRRKRNPVKPGTG
jgi:hypothetical protein